MRVRSFESSHRTEEVHSHGNLRATGGDAATSRPGIRRGPRPEDGDQGRVQDHRVLGDDCSDRRHFVSAALIDGGDNGTDEFIARQAWLYVAILGGAYFISRGLAKSGSSDRIGMSPTAPTGETETAKRPDAGTRQAEATLLTASAWSPARHLAAAKRAR